MTSSDDVEAYLENIQSEKIFDEIARLRAGSWVSDQPGQAGGEIFRPLVNQHPEIMFEFNLKYQAMQCILLLCFFCPAICLFPDCPG